jgi:ABC-2 type transport system ATP-binding protein
MTPAAALVAEQVTVRRGGRTLLRDVDLELARGEVVHLRGPNGVGKTSLLRVLCGLSHPRGGAVSRRTTAAFVPETVALAPLITPGEWLTTMRSLRKEPPVDWAGPLDESGVDPGVLDQASAALSKGTLQRVALVEALACECGLLFMDEPSSGLDDSGRQWLSEAVATRARRGAAVLVADHWSAGKAGLSADRTLDIADGRIRAVDAPPDPGNAALVGVRWRDANGEVASAGVAEEDVDELLRRLLEAGHHVLRVGQ